MVITLPKAVWRTPESWGNSVFCTWKQLSEIASELRSAGVEADSYQAEQYILLGDATRGAPRGWYHSSGYGTADGQTTWSGHCVLLNPSLAILKENSYCVPLPSADISAAERLVLMQCLTHAH
jgi:hypothetical protein